MQLCTFAENGQGDLGGRFGGAHRPDKFNSGEVSQVGNALKALLKGDTPAQECRP